MSSNYNDTENYCKDCDRSIYGKYPSCDINIENDGRYVKAGSPCYCKVSSMVGGMVEKYPWENRKLKRCPFCGGEAHIMKMGYPHWVFCKQCGAKVHGGKFGEREGEVASIEAWNRRVKDE